MEEHIRKAGKAKELLENDLLKEAFEKVEESLIKSMKQADLSQDYQGVSKHRDSIMLSLIILGKVQSTLYQYIENGKIAESMIEAD